MTTSRLSMPELETTQAQKEVVHNEGIAILDAWTQAVVINRTVLSPPGSPTKGDSYVVGPSGASGGFAGKEDYLTVYNGSTWDFYFPLEGFSCWNLDEDDVIRYVGGIWDTAAGAATGPYIISLSVPNTMEGGQLLLAHAASYQIDLPSGLTGSVAVALTASTGSVTIPMYKRVSPYSSSSSIGSINFSAGNKVGTFTFATGQTFAATDLLEIYAPGTADATLEGVAISLRGTRS